MIKGMSCLPPPVSPALDPVSNLVLSSIFVPVFVNAERIVSTEAFGMRCFSNAQVPATCGAAIDVPLVVAIDVLLEL